MTIVDTGVGNFASIENAIRRAGGTACVARTQKDIDQASHIVLPGVGNFDAAIGAIDERNYREILTRKVLDQGTPLLGICLGMQLLGKSSEEGSLNGLGWFNGRSTRLTGQLIRVPHIGWNNVHSEKASPLLDGIEADTKFYFVHSYHYVSPEADDVLASTDYGYRFAAIIKRGNIVGTQFHPEKSGGGGLRLLRNFLRMTS